MSKHNIGKFLRVRLVSNVWEWKITKSFLRVEISKEIQIFNTKTKSFHYILI